MSSWSPSHLTPTQLEERRLRAAATVVRRDADPAAEGRTATVATTREAGRLTFQRGGPETALHAASALLPRLGLTDCSRRRPVHRDGLAVACARPRAGRRLLRPELRREEEECRRVVCLVPADEADVAPLNRLRRSLETAGSGLVVALAGSDSRT